MTVHPEFVDETTYLYYEKPGEAPVNRIGQPAPAWSPLQARGINPASTMTMTALLSDYGSFRRLCEAYWRGEMTPERERILEDSHPKEILASYKPIAPLPEKDQWGDD